jgi:hypothetical protein
MQASLDRKEEGKEMKLLKRAQDKDFWVEVRNKDCFASYRQELLSLWDKHCTKELPMLTYTDFKRFWDTGDRKTYESKYFSRRLAMDASALLALIYPEEEKYLSKLMDVIYVICDEYTWCLPAHQKILETNNNSVVDLFASETGFALAEIYTMLEKRLDPLIKNRIKAEIERRIITSYMSREPYAWWETSGSNWNAVCTGSVACTVMLMFPELFESLKPRFDRAMEFYLDGFKDDGICVEGCGYWHYGFGFFAVYADAVREFTNGETDYFVREKVKTVSTFIQKMFLSGNACVSFADGGRTLSYHLGLVHYLKKEYPDDITVYSPRLSYNYDSCGRFCLQLRALLWMNEEYYYNYSESSNEAYFALDSQWFVKTTENYGFAAKGGHNNELHNHNDVGSFIFAKDGRQVLSDLGPGVYTRQYFSKERYDILECSSRGHSVPIIDGKHQKFGERYAAKEARYENGVFSADISGAYALEELVSLRRSFSFSESRVCMRDHFVYHGNGEIIERFITLKKPELMGEGEITVDGATLSFNADSCTVSISEEKRLNGEYCYLMDFKLKSGVRVFAFDIE